MPTWSRLLIVCALMLALPLKVLAGVGLGCADGHGPASSTPEALAPGAIHAGHDHMAHGHVAHDHQAHDHVSAAQVPSQTSDAQDEGSGSGCSHCAPCCAAALPAAEPPCLPTVHPEPHVVPLLDGPLADVVAEVPDRPPRHHLA